MRYSQCICITLRSTGLLEFLLLTTLAISFSLSFRIPNADGCTRLPYAFVSVMMGTTTFSLGSGGGAAVCTDVAKIVSTSMRKLKGVYMGYRCDDECLVVVMVRV